MNTKCNKVIFSTRAYNAVICGTYSRVDTETGGIFLGQILDGTWYILESIDPGPNSIFTLTRFEYDYAYVNHLARALSIQYKIPLALLGLWHRHPGSMDSFSSVDDGTNTLFAKLCSGGSISGLVNLDPKFRFTMYHVVLPLAYRKVPIEVGDNWCPRVYFELRHFNGQEPTYPNQTHPSFPLESREETIQIVDSLSHTSNEPEFIEGKPKGKRESLVTKFVRMFDQPFKKNRQSSSAMIDTIPIEGKAVQMENGDVSFLDDENLIGILAVEDAGVEKLGYQFGFVVNPDTRTFECTVTGTKIRDGIKNPFQLYFSMEYKDGTLNFLEERNRHEFSEGIVTRFVESKINQTQFQG